MWTNPALKPWLHDKASDSSSNTLKHPEFLRHKPSNYLRLEVLLDRVGLLDKGIGCAIVFNIKDLHELIGLGTCHLSLH